MGESEKKTAARKWHHKKKNYDAVKPPPVKQDKFKGGKDELDGNHFDCTGYGQSDRFVKTVEKIADYVGQEYKCGGIARREVLNQQVVIIAAPTRPVGRSMPGTDGAVIFAPIDAMDVSDYQSAKKIYDTEIHQQKENRQKLFSMVWQQCTENLHAKIKSNREYQKIEQSLDGVELLRVIKLICFNIEDEKYVPQKAIEVKAAFYNMKQGKHESDQAYQVKFLNAVQVIEQCGSSLGEDPLVRALVCKDLGYSIDTRNTVEISEITKTVRDYTLGAALILGVDPDRYSSMLKGLKNASLAGRDEWPKTVTEAFNYLSKWEGDFKVGR
jgi:hypothetical protein